MLEKRSQSHAIICDVLFLSNDDNIVLSPLRILIYSFFSSPKSAWDQSVDRDLKTFKGPQSTRIRAKDDAHEGESHHAKSNHHHLPSILSAIVEDDRAVSGVAERF